MPVSLRFRDPAIMSTAADSPLSLAHYYLPVYRPRQVVLERGQGSRVWDDQGREYLDLSSGIAVSGLGHNDPDLMAALTEQAASCGTPATCSSARRR